MVLEKIESVREAVRNPWQMFLIGGMISVVCLFISFIVFPQSVGLFTTFLITFALTPFMVDLIRHEEVMTEEEIAKRKNMNLFNRHRGILLVYIAMFAGMVLSLSIIFLMLPQNIVGKMFEDQINEINFIRGSIAFGGTFEKIFFNNIGVLFLAFLFSFLFGSGAIFILAWNASVLATAIGITAKSIGGIKGLPIAILTFFPHGSLEILAYFIGGVAGGIVSAAITRRKSKWFHVILVDSATLMITAIVLLFIAAMIETASIALA